MKKIYNDAYFLGKKKETLRELEGKSEEARWADRHVIAGLKYDIKQLKAKDFTPSDDMMHAAKTVFLCMAVVETVKPIVEGYQKKILAEMQAGPKAEWCEGRRGLKPDDLILDPERSYLLSDNDFQYYLKKCNEEREKAKLHVDNPEFCPLLVVQDNLRKAQHILIDAMQPLTGVGFDDLFKSEKGLENYEKYIDLSLKLLAPFIDSKKILKRLYPKQ